MFSATNDNQALYAPGTNQKSSEDSMASGVKHIIDKGKVWTPK